MTVRRGTPRPASTTRPAFAVLAVTLALLGIAKTTGSGWLIVLIAIVAAVAILSFVLPIPAVLRARVELDAPADGMVGRPLLLTLTVTGTRRPMVARVRESDGEWTTVLPPVRGRLEATPAKRGIVGELTVDLRCAAPLGFVWWGRASHVTLDRPIEVGPAPIDAVAPPPAGADAVGDEDRATGRAGDDLVRGVRDYAPGDPIKTVHWVATARHGRLMVREREAAAAPPIDIVVDLGTGGPGGERAASLAAGLALAALADDVPVTLHTREQGGPLSGGVRTSVDVSRRLARAVPGRPPDGATGHGRIVRVDVDGVHA